MFLETETVSLISFSRYTAEPLGAAEIASFLAAIIDAGLPINALAGALCFHPTYAETLQEAAEKLYDLLRDSQHGPAH